MTLTREAPPTLETDTRRPLRVAMIAPPWFELPPTGYGGIEAMCAALIDELAATGTTVTLLGVGRNGTGADFHPLTATAQHERMGEVLPEVTHAGALLPVLAALSVDVVHDHTLVGPLLAPAHGIPTVVTAHGPLTGDMATYYRQISRNVQLTAISDAQRRQAPDIPWAGTIHNAVPVSEFPFARSKGDYAVFLGRLSPEKGLPLAIDAARSAGVPLVIAAKHGEPNERAYFDAEVAPRLGPDVTWVGEVGGARKLALLAGARCLLFPVCWEEPFGMVMIEALACGTPVVALRRGAVPEVLVDGVTGLICDDPAQLPAALHRVRSLQPLDCRRDAERRFDSAAMAANYLLAYRRAMHRAGVLARGRGSRR